MPAPIHDMNPIPNLAYYKQLQSSPSLCNWSKLFSSTVWEKINFCRSTAKMQIFETSITQDLIYQFWLLACSTKMPVQIYQSKDEKANGSDLEICVQTAKGYFMVPCQAKIVSKNSKYRAITHKVKGTYQIDLLLAYGAKVGGLPMYLLYNFHDNKHENQLLEKQHKLNIFELGCSLCPAENLKKTCWISYPGKMSVPGFYQIHEKIAIPFSKLFCSIGTSEILEEIETPLAKITFYDEESLTDSDRWNSLIPAAAIGRISNPSDEREIERTQFEEQPTSYNPKFRILLSTEKRIPRLISN
jgi:hypothetical protein